MNELLHIELAGCLVVDSAGRLLLIHRNYKGIVQWEVPGGKIHLGEIPADAASREVFEELNISVEPEKLLLENKFSEYDHHYKYFVFLSSLGNQTPKITENKFDKFGFLSLAELLKCKSELSANMRLILDYIISNKYETAIR